MRKLLTVAVGVVVGTVAAAYAAGPVYTIPADYEKMKKVVEGLAGTTNLSTLSDTQAQNAGANVKAFVEGATGKSTTSTYSPTYFRYYGANYRNFVWGAANADPGSSTNNALFKTVGNNYRNFTVNAAGVGVQDGRTYLFQFAGRNYRNLAQGLTGLGITDYRYYYYNYAGRNVKNLAEGQTGLSIRDYRYWYYRNAGANYKSLAQGLANGQSITYDPYSSYNNYQQTKMQQFKQRADQTFYDMYLNPNGMKKAFTTMDTSITSKTAGLTPISTNNKAEFDGGVRLSGVFMSSQASFFASGTANDGIALGRAITGAIRRCKLAGYDGGIIVQAGIGGYSGEFTAYAVAECYEK